jgi:hypothetical protein
MHLAQSERARHNRGAAGAAQCGRGLAAAACMPCLRTLLQHEMQHRECMQQLSASHHDVLQARCRGATPTCARKPTPASSPCTKPMTKLSAVQQACVAHAHTLRCPCTHAASASQAHLVSALSKRSPHQHSLKWALAAPVRRHCVQGLPSSAVKACPHTRCSAGGETAVHWSGLPGAGSTVGGEVPASEAAVRPGHQLRGQWPA